MGIRFDADRIAARHRVARTADEVAARHRDAPTRDRAGCDVWFVLPGESASESVRLVQAACAECGVQPVALWAVGGGVFVRLPERGWREAGQAVAQWLERDGQDVVVTVPPAPPATLLFKELMLPCLVMAHRLDPPAASVRRRDRLLGHWMLPEAARRRRLDLAARWAVEPSGVAGVGRIRLVPVERGDFDGQLESALGDTIHPADVNGCDPSGALSREIRFEDWGVSAWRGSYPGLSQIERVERLCELLVEAAPDLEVGGINFLFTRSSGLFTTVPDVPWDGVPQLWSTYLPDAYAVQVVTDEHLAKAHDLSAWHVETVAPGRHLVRAKDLQPWFNLDANLGPYDPETRSMRQFPADDVLDQARHDFGDMILSYETYREFVARTNAAEAGPNEVRQPTTEMTDGVLKVEVPADWNIEVGQPSSPDDPLAWFVTATALDNTHFPIAYIARREGGRLEDFAEDLLQHELADGWLPENPDGIRWADAMIAGLLGRQLRTGQDPQNTPHTQPLRIVVLTAPEPPEAPAAPDQRRLTALVTRSPTGSTAQLHQNGMIWVSLRACGVDNRPPLRPRKP